MDNWQPFYFEKEFHYDLKNFDYKTIVEDYVFTDETGKEEASLFSYSYIKCHENNERPVMFCYNGGPGVSSNWVHMGLLGPKQVSFPEYPDSGIADNGYVYGDNANFILDEVDLVMINPPGTDMTLLEKESEDKFYSTEGDATAIVEFIEYWLRKYGRMNSPVFLLGESYGTIRNLAIADLLPDSIRLGGIVSIGTSFNVGSPTTMLIEPNVRRLGANAACNWYHNHREEKPLTTFIKEAIDFAYSEYAHALLMGNRLPEDEFEATLEKLHYYTGLSKDVLRAGKLRFDEMTFLMDLLPGRLVSAYDSRISRPLAHKMSQDEWEEAFATEPFFNFANGKIEEGMDRYLDEELARPENRHIDLSEMIQIAMRWNYSLPSKDTLELPVELMERKPKMRIMFVAGYYDLQSTFDFVTYYMGRYDLPEERITFNIYESGHASYIGGNSANEVCEDIRKFIASAAVE